MSHQLSFEEFLQPLQEDFPQLKVTMDDLKNPSQQFAIRYYSTLVEDVTRMLSDLLEPTPAQMEILSVCNISDHIKTINLFKALKYIFIKVNLNFEFRYSDLMAPSHSTLRSFTFMAALFRFHHHCAEFDEIYEEVDQSQVKKDRIQQLKEEQLILKEKIKLKELRKKERRDQMEENKKLLAELTRKNEEAELKLKNLQQIKEQRQLKLRTLQEQEDVLQDEFNRAENEKMRHESLVVSDPGKIIEHHATLSHKKDESYRELQGLEQQVTEKSARVCQFDTVLSLYTSLVQKLREEMVGVGVGKATLDMKDMYCSLVSFKKDILGLQKEISDLEGEEKDKNDNLSKQAIALDQLRKEHESDHRARSLDLARTRSSIDEIRRSLQDFVNRAPIEEACRETLGRQMSEMAAATEQIWSEIKSSDEYQMARYKEFKLQIAEIIATVVEEATAYMESHNKSK